MISGEKLCEKRCEKVTVQNREVRNVYNPDKTNGNYFIKTTNLVDC